MSEYTDPSVFEAIRAFARLRRPCRRRGGMGRQRWKLTGVGRMDTWGDAPKADPEWADLLAWMAAEPDSGMYEIAPGWYSSRPARMTEDGSILDT